MKAKSLLLTLLFLFAVQAVTAYPVPDDEIDRVFAGPHNMSNLSKEIDRGTIKLTNENLQNRFKSNDCNAVVIQHRKEGDRDKYYVLVNMHSSTKFEKTEVSKEDYEKLKHFADKYDR